MGVGFGIRTPTAYDDSYIADVEFDLLIDATEGVVANDYGRFPSTTLTAVLDEAPEYGTLKYLNDDGAFWYIPPAPNDWPTPDPEDEEPGNLSVSFTYHVEDDQGYFSNTATVNIKVVHYLDPVPTNDTLRIREGAFFGQVDAFANDADPNGDSLVIASVSDPDHGDVFWEGGVITYVASGTPVADSFTYTVADGHRGFTTATVTVALNNAPTSDEVVVVESDDGAYSGTIGWSDADSETPAMTLGTPASYGSVALHSDGTFDYYPVLASSGSDTFTIVASDGADTTTTVVHVNVSGTPSYPTMSGKVDSTGYAVDMDGGWAVSGGCRTGWQVLYGCGIELLQYVDGDWVSQVLDYVDPEAASADVLKDKDHINVTDGDDLQFGAAVAMDGFDGADLQNARIIVGAPNDHDSSNQAPGAAYIWHYENGAWQAHKLLSPESTAGDHFGHTVDISGDIAVIGGTYRKGYVYRYHDDAEAGVFEWTHVEDITGPTTGCNMAIDDDVIVVGGSTTTVSLYRRESSSSDVWTAESFTSSVIPRSVAISGDTIVVGDYEDGATDTGAIAIHTSTYNSGTDSYDWAEEMIANLPTLATDTFLGRSVAIDGGVVVAGATDIGNNDPGALYIYERSLLHQWSFSETIAGGLAGYDRDNLGRSVSVDNNVVIGGAPGSDRVRIATVAPKATHEMVVNSRSVAVASTGQPLFAGTVGAWDDTGELSALPTGYEYKTSSLPADVTVAFAANGNVTVTSTYVHDIEVDYWVEDDQDERVSNVSTLAIKTGDQSATPSGITLDATANTGSVDFTKLTITNYNNTACCRLLEFTVTGVTAAATVRVYDELGRKLVEGIVATGQTQLSLAVTVEAELLNGFHRLRATQQLSGDAESDGANMDVMVDTVRPEIPYLTSLNLNETDDSGMSPRDNVTNVQNLDFDILAGTTWSTVHRKGPDDPFYIDLTGLSDDPEVSESSLGDGEYLYQVQAWDLAGNNSYDWSSALSVIVDTIAPTTTPALDLVDNSDRGAFNSDDITSDPTPTFAVTGSEFGYRVTRDSVQVSGDYERLGSFESWDPSFWIPADTDIEGLITAEGEWVDRNTPSGEEDYYTYGVTAVDLAGNAATTTGELEVYVDRVAPSMPDVSGDEDSDLNLAAISDMGPLDDDEITNLTTLNFGVTVNGVFPEAEYYRVSRDGAQISADYESLPGYFEDSGIEAAYGASIDDTLEYRLIAVDLAGNATTSDALDVLIDTIVPSQPSSGVLNLQAGSDSGSSSLDNITNATSLAFDVNITPECYFRVQRNGTVVGNQFNYWSNPATWTDTTAPQSPVDWDSDVITPHQYAAAQVDLAGNVSAYSTALPVLVDRAGSAFEILINGGDSQRHVIETIEVFLTDGATLDGDELTIYKDTGSSWQEMTSLDTESMFDDQTNTWTFDGELSDGTYYTAVIDGGGFSGTDLAGNSVAIDLVAHFHQFDLDMDGDGGMSQGDVDMFYDAVAVGTDLLYDIGSYDANNDPIAVPDGYVTMADIKTLIGIYFNLVLGDINVSGNVDLEDFFLLKQNFGMSNAEWSDGDLDFDGDVDLNDFFILKSNFGSSTTLDALDAMTAWA